MVALGGMHGCSRGACMVAPGGVVAWGVMCGCSQGGMCGCSGGHVWLLLGGAWLLQGGHAWDTTRYGDTVNEQAVRILQECILVKCIIFSLERDRYQHLLAKKISYQK